MMHPDLRPSDSTVYAVIYWFEKMKDGKCTASNETIADVAVIEARSVRASLDRLERAGFVERVFFDKCKQIRNEIKTTVSFTKTQRLPFISPTTKVTPEMIQPGRLITVGDIKAHVTSMTETPGQFARRFFDGDKDAYKDIVMEMLFKSHGRGADILEREIPKFIAYWTEPTKTGRKQLWETKPTFEVRRRLATWFNNIKERQSVRRAGAGAMV